MGTLQKAPRKNGKRVPMRPGNGGSNPPGAIPILAFRLSAEIRRKAVCFLLRKKGRLFRFGEKVRASLHLPGGIFISFQGKRYKQITQKNI